jgi:hypothetical protein
MALLPIKWSKIVEEFIVDKMIEERIFPSDVFTKYQNQLPSIRQHEKQWINSERYRAKLESAYAVLLDFKASEYNAVSSMTPVEYYLHTGKSSDSENVDFKDAAAYHRERLNSLKYQINFISTLFVKKQEAIKRKVEKEAASPPKDIKPLFTLPSLVKQGQ